MNKVTFRSFQKGDYEMVCGWWHWWWKGEKGIERKLLPDNSNCLILEHNNNPLYAGFLYLGKNAPIGYLTWIVSNPNYKVESRKTLLETFITSIEQKAKREGVEFIFTVCGNKTLKLAHKNLDWWVDDKLPSYEGFKHI